MTVPGVNVIVAATFMAAVGDIRRFPDRRKLTAYLGLDPRVRQSGAGPATHGHISKQGSAAPATRSSRRAGRPSASPARSPRFYQRINARRGHSIAIVAAARKLACLFWCLLTRGEDYAFAQPSLTTKKMRRLELTAGAAALPGRPRRLGDQRRDAPGRTRARAPSPARLRTHRQRPASRSKAGASATPGRASQRPSKGKAARQTTSP